MQSNQKIVRLNVLLQERGVASRRKADALILTGSVKVNGEIIHTLGAKVPYDADLWVDGVQYKKKPPLCTVLFHKPDASITSRNDPQGRKTIFDFFRAPLPLNVQPVGRLDYRSEGLLILTNDGDLSFALTHPKHSVEKTYSVLVASPLTIEDVETLRKGILLEDGLAKPLSVRLLGREKMGSTSGQWVEIIVTEGRNRLVRRMLEALGVQIVRLIRVGIGVLRLPSALAPGQHRPITAEEKKYLNELKEDMLVASAPKKEEKTFSVQKTKKISLNDDQYKEHVKNRMMTNSRKNEERKKQTVQVPESTKVSDKNKTKKRTPNTRKQVSKQVAKDFNPRQKDSKNKKVIRKTPRDSEKQTREKVSQDQKFSKPKSTAFQKPSKKKTERTQSSARKKTRTVK